MHVEALADNPKGAMAAAAPESTGPEPLTLDNLEGVFLLCSVVTAAAVIAIVAEALIGKNVAGFFKCLGVYFPERRERNCDLFKRNKRRDLELLPN